MFYIQRGADIHQRMWYLKFVILFVYLDDNHNDEMFI